MQVVEWITLAGGIVNLAVVAIGGTKAYYGLSGKIDKHIAVEDAVNAMRDKMLKEVHEKVTDGVFVRSTECAQRCAKMKE